MLHNNPDIRTQSLQRTMQGHAALGVLVGLIGGWLFAFAQLQEVNVWPLFAFDVNMPGDKHGWAEAHVGPILNGLLCAFGASILPRMSGTQRTVIAYSLIATVWGNTIFYFCVPFGNVHCLTGGYAKAFGVHGNVFDAIGYVVAVLVAPLTMASMVMIAITLLRPDRGTSAPTTAG